MLSLVEVEKPTKRVRGFYEPLVKECLDLIAAGKARTVAEAAWMTCRAHPDQQIHILTLENYTRLARRFHIEPSKESVAG